jgi:flagellin-like hook-associated protein FlgL
VNDGNTNSVRLLRGSGQGTFSHHATISNGYYQQMRAADFNRDGRLDFVGVQEAGNVDVHTQSSTGSFTLTPFVVTNATSVELGDLDNDGDTDIVTGGYISFIPGSKQYRVLQNNGGAFTNLGGVNGGAMEGGGGPLSLVDFDGNGTLDIIGRGDHMILYSGNGDGTFGNSRTFFSGVNAFSVGDMNSDGTLDIVGIDSTSALGYTNDPDPVRTVTKLDPNSLRLRTRNEARTTLNAVNVLLRRLGLEQGGLGAAESRLNSALRNSQISRTVSLEASARIMDADIASESSALSRLRILREAGTAVLAQANLQPQIALQLLGG